MPVGQHRRLSDAGFGNASSSHKTFTAAQQEPVETAAGANGQTPRSPAARKAGSSPSAGARSSRSPVSSPPRQPRSPARAVVSGGGFGPGTFGAPDGSSGGGDIADVLASYLDDFRHEVRDMVHGMQVDMVRQSVAAEMLYQKDIAVLQQSNRVLREEIGRLRQELAANMPFEPL
ncbi:hypothetical protein PLESTB_000440600 [Pleodorina starrii]|uniref:Uncharacterized protein n=1 Tax=Pleodorina starrii TaxID=330485 RepID=A0A9W6F015_9CHLO|nr:hypothetical protein PLESTB_000440600 [Pleodorina starrii]GLC73939.1 hypothetical protein PLESTF_001439800 [Pleodorina starrii]